LAWWVAGVYGHWSYQRLSYAGRREWKSTQSGRWCHVEPRPSTPIGLVVKRGVIRGYHDVGSEDLRS
jgi:hypothetical protein